MNDEPQRLTALGGNKGCQPGLPASAGENIPHSGQTGPAAVQLAMRHWTHRAKAGKIPTALGGPTSTVL
jgi:hypothetical protein